MSGDERTTIPRPVPQEVFSGGATTSQHIEATDDDHFENTTYSLKRTPSLGYLDDFIEPEKQVGKISSQVPQQQVAPAVSQAGPPPSSAFDSPELMPHDDADIVDQPHRHVDYLSYQWDITDISKSWRYIVSKRNTVTNAARLENASWRTWAQRQGNLKTISPVAVNWSKDSDVTWLYGPILQDDGKASEDDPRREVTVTSKEAGDIQLPCYHSPKKGIIRHRTRLDQIISCSNLLKHDLAANKELQRRKDEQNSKLKAMSEKTPEFFNYDAISGRLNQQYKHVQPSSNPSLTKLQSLLNKKDPPAPEPVEISPVKSQEVASVESMIKPARHIHFDETVQQCIAVDNYFETDDEREGSSTPQAIYLDSDDGDSDDDEDQDGGFFLSVPPSGAGLSIANSVSRSSDTESELSDSVSTTSSKFHFQTIQMLSPTTINYGSSEEDTDDEYTYTSSMSHKANHRGYDYYYDYDYDQVYQANPTYTGLKIPDIVDIPENIALGFVGAPVADGPPVLPTTSPSVLPSQSKLPPHQPKMIMDEIDSESDSDSDGGLSISASNSSKDLAQSVFGGFTNHFPIDQSPQCVNAPTSTINPNHTSSSKLSSLFAGNEESDDALVKQPRSSSSLADEFLGHQPLTRSQLTDSFLGRTSSPDSSGRSTPIKSAPVPPKTTEEYATSVMSPPRRLGGFMLQDDSSDDSD